LRRPLQLKKCPYPLIEAGSYSVALSLDIGEQRYDPFGGSLSGAFSAHPHRDPRTGEQFAVCYDLAGSGSVTHLAIDRSGKAIREEQIDLTHLPMIHDCAFSARYVVVLDLPVLISDTVEMPFRCTPENGARVGLLPRGAGSDQIIWCQLPPAFAFHAANVYDRADGTVVIDLCVYDSMFSDDPLTDGRQRGIERWVLDPKTNSAPIEIIDTAPQEFPRIDERFSGQAHRFIYSVALRTEEPNPAGFATKLYRHDLSAGSRDEHEFGAGRFPGEFVFIPRNEKSPEGSGWLMGFVIDKLAGNSEFVILDTERFTGEPQAIVVLPHQIPAGFHGNWIPNSKV